MVGEIRKNRRRKSNAKKRKIEKSPKDQKNKNAKKKFESSDESEDRVRETEERKKLAADNSWIQNDYHQMNRNKNYEIEL